MFSLLSSDISGDEPIYPNISLKVYLLNSDIMLIIYIATLTVYIPYFTAKLIILRPLSDKLLRGLPTLYHSKLF